MRTAVIVNSSIRKRNLRRISRFFRDYVADRDVSVLYTRGRGDATRLAERSISMGASKLIAVGGDGTVNEVLHGMLGSRCRLGVIPAGTANDLARHLGMPLRLHDAWQIVMTGEECTGDVVRVNDRYFLTTCGVGLPAESIRLAARARRLAGLAILRHRLYALSLMCCLGRNHHCPEVTIATNGERQSYRAMSLTVSNVPVLGACFRVSPGSRLDDGRISLCLINARGLLDRFRLVRRVLDGSHGTLPGVNFLRARSVRLSLDRPTALFRDGELDEPVRELDIELFPGAVRLLCPRITAEVTDAD